MGGALALIGFRVLIWLPYYFIASIPMISVRLITSLVTAVALPIGIATLLGRASAICCAKIYLWFSVITACVAIPLDYYFDREHTLRSALRYLPELLSAVVLLALIFWSRSRKFENEPKV